MEFSPTVPEPVRWIATTLEGAGFETWVVGGAIRDLVLGYEAEDWDLATSARPHEIMEAFARTVPVGIEHGTVGVLARGTLYEVTTFRRDVETHGRHAVVEFAEDIEEDLARRDFTFNAIAWNPLSGRLLDPSEGLADLKAHILRTVGDPERRFAEDRLRVLRALRFSGQFGFAIEDETWRALCDAVSELHMLSAERVQEELMKVLSLAVPSVALELYARSGALAELYPELAGVAEVRSASSRQTLLRACDAVPAPRSLVRLATLLSPIARERPGDPRAVYATVERLLGRLRFSNAATERVSALVSNRTRVVPSCESSDIRRWLHRTGPTLFPDTARIWIAEARAGLDPVADAASVPADAVAKRVRAARAVLRAKPPLAVSDLALNGEHLQAMGLHPGPRFGVILRNLLDHVLEHPEANTRTELEAFLSLSGFLTESSQPPDMDDDPT